MNKKYIIASAVALAVSFAVGRYTTPVKVVEIEKKTKQSETEKNVKRKTEIKEKVNPDGSKETNTTVTEETNTQKNSSSETEKQREETRGESRVHISGLASVLPASRNQDLGIHVSKDILGPVSVGAWGFKSGVYGVSVGLSF